MNKIAATTKILYAQLCAGCHGADLKGVATKPGLVNKKLNYGSSFAVIKKSVIEDVVTKGMLCLERCIV